MQNTTASQNRPGRRAAEHAAIGVEREREQHEHEHGEGRDLLGRDPRPPLDAQVLAGDERSVTEHGRAPFAMPD